MGHLAKGAAYYKVPVHIAGEPGFLNPGIWQALT
jgi:hypothetical protein